MKATIVSTLLALALIAFFAPQASAVSACVGENQECVYATEFHEAAGIQCRYGVYNFEGLDVGLVCDGFGNAPKCTVGIEAPSLQTGGPCFNENLPGPDTCVLYVATTPTSPAQGFVCNVDL